MEIRDEWYDEWMMNKEIPMLWISQSELIYSPRLEIITIFCIE